MECVSYVVHKVLSTDVGGGLSTRVCNKKEMVGEGNNDDVIMGGKFTMI